MPLLVLLLCFLAALLLAIPVGSALGLTAALPGIFDASFTVGAKYLIRSMVGGLDSFPLLALPMFVLSGAIMARGGISRKIFSVFVYFLGNFTGGIPCAVIATCLFYGAISGSAPATVAAVGTMAIPFLVKLGYDKTFSTALVATAGGLGVIIPPSIPFILFGMAAGESVGDLFAAGILPGLTVAALLMAYAVLHSRRHGENRQRICAQVDALRGQGLLPLLKDSFFALLSPVIVLGCIYSGLTSPTEAAAISVFYALVISLAVYRDMGWRELWQAVHDTVRTYTPILFILAASTAFSRVLTLLDIPQAVSAFVLGSFSHRSAVLLLLNAVLLAVGMVMDTTPAILILTPILLPVAAGIGVDPLQLGVITVVNLAIGFVTPPIGVNLFVAGALADVPVLAVAKKALPLILCFLAALLLFTFVPAFSLLLS